MATSSPDHSRPDIVWPGVNNWDAISLPFSSRQLWSSKLKSHVHPATQELRQDLNPHVFDEMKYRHPHQKVRTCSFETTISSFYISKLISHNFVSTFMTSSPPFHLYLCRKIDIMFTLPHFYACLLPQERNSHQLSETIIKRLLSTKLSKVSEQVLTPTRWTSNYWDRKWGEFWETKCFNHYILKSIFHFS